MVCLRVASIVNDSIVDGPGLRLTVFVQGCDHRCPGCHNPQTHSHTGGTEMSCEDIFDIVRGNPLLDGVTFSGGEPFDQAEELARLGCLIKEQLPHLNIITYTGYQFEYLLAGRQYRDLLRVTDILIDGPYIEKLRSLELRFRGSSNQRILDCKHSCEVGKPVDYEL